MDGACGARDGRGAFESDRAIERLGRASVEDGICSSRVER
jgi:hypothetical protein